MRIALICVIVALTARPAVSANYQSIGVGNASCGTWTEDRRTPETPIARARVQWVLGFLSGAGYAGDIDPLAGLDGQAVVAWMDNYCRAHPLAQITKAAAHFTEEHPR